MLSKECTDCLKIEECSKRYQNAKKGEKIYCPDGTIHFADDYLPMPAIDFCLFRI
ncbi:MAG: hypothetical protein NWF00_02315 [Candidatus Bathyarchaeota archaeon]|nr:hypothetical protein [Candidatus Bathyarchaeota archaeon]